MSLCASSLAPKSSIVSNVKELLAGDKEYTNDFLLIIDDRESAEYAVFLNAQKKYLTADDYRMNIDEVKGMIADKARAKVEAEYRPLKKKADRIIEQRKREIKKRKSIIESLKDERVKGRRMGKIVHYGIVSILLVFSVSSFLWQNFEHSTYFSIFAIFCAFIVQFGKSDFLMKKVADFYLARKAKKLDFFNVLKRIGTHR
ncbi:hypothetical protein CLM76_11535 [Vreelandella venusta]|nr:hypothetical protein CLM76_11535 [Halomonas hydrothermalis]